MLHPRPPQRLQGVPGRERSQRKPISSGRGTSANENGAGVGIFGTAPSEGRRDDKSALVVSTSAYEDGGRIGFRVALQEPVMSSSGAGRLCILFSAAFTSSRREQIPGYEPEEASPVPETFGLKRRRELGDVEADPFEMRVR